MEGKITNPSGIPEDEFLREGLIDRLRQYIEAEPGAWHVRYNLAVALMHHGELDEALAQFREVLRQAPKHLESLVNMGGIYLSRGQAEEALRAFTNALSVWDVPLVRANIAVAYMQLGRMDAAEQQLRIALDMDERMPDAWCNLATVLMHRGEPAQAAEAARKALSFREDFAMAHNNLAAALLELGEVTEARKHASRALELGYPVPEGMLKELGIAPAGEKQDK